METINTIHLSISLLAVCICTKTKYIFGKVGKVRTDPPHTPTHGHVGIHLANKVGPQILWNQSFGNQCRGFGAESFGPAHDCKCDFVNASQLTVK